MATTGQLGGPDSRLGNLALGAAPEPENTVAATLPAVTCQAYQQITATVAATLAAVTCAAQLAAPMNPVVLAAMTQGIPVSSPSNRLQGVALRVSIWDDGWGNGTPQIVDAISADVESSIFGMEPGGVTPASATVQCAGFLPSAVDPSKGRQRIQIEAGLMVGGGTFAYEVLFTGLTLGPLQRNHEAKTWEMRASGYSSLLADRIGKTVVYYRFDNFTDGPILRDLCAKMGVPAYNVAGSTYHVYSVDNNRLVLRAGTAPLGEIARMCAVTLRPMWDDRFGTVQRSVHVTSPPASSWTYEEGDPSAGFFAALEWERDRPWTASRSKIRVFGYRSNTPGTDRPNAGSRDTGSALANPNADSIAAETIEYPGLERSADCGGVCADHMLWRDRVEDVATLRLPPNPYLGPCDVLTVAAAPGIGPIGADQDFLILAVHHHVAESWTTTVRGLSTSSDGQGSITPYSLKPSAAFSVNIVARPHAPDNEVADLLDYDWEATCDGSGSTGEDGQGIENLGYEWVSNVAARNAQGFGGVIGPQGTSGEIFVVTVDGLTHFLGNSTTTLVVITPEGVRSDPVTHNT